MLVPKLKWTPNRFWDSPISKSIWGSPHTDMGIGFLVFFSVTPKIGLFSPKIEAIPTPWRTSPHRKFRQPTPIRGSPNRFGDPRTEYQNGDPQSELPWNNSGIPKPIRGSPNWNGDQDIPIPKRGSPNRFSVINQKRFGVYSNLGLYAFIPKLERHSKRGPHTKTGIPESVWGLPELISKSGSPRIGLGFISIWGLTFTHLRESRICGSILCLKTISAKNLSKTSPFFWCGKTATFPATSCKNRPFWSNFGPGRRN